MLNCSIAKNLKYNKATPTFHQWRDQRQVFGLNFKSAQDANIFSHAVEKAIEFMNLPPGTYCYIYSFMDLFQHHWSIINIINIKLKPRKTCYT